MSGRPLELSVSVCGRHKPCSLTSGLIASSARRSSSHCGVLTSSRWHTRDSVPRPLAVRYSWSCLEAMMVPARCSSFWTFLNLDEFLWALLNQISWIWVKSLNFLNLFEWIWVGVKFTSTSLVEWWHSTRVKCRSSFVGKCVPWCFHYYNTVSEGVDSPPAGGF